MKRRLMLLVCVAPLAACASPELRPADRPTTVVLPLAHAWTDGRLVQYITTDTSDYDLARKMGINHVPRLAHAASKSAPTGSARYSALERVYMFHDDAQINVFPSSPQPTGPDNQDAAYSPLWRAAMVRWLQPGQRRELRSEESILAAQDRGWVSVTVTDLVINCPVVRSVDGKSLRGVF